MADQTSLLNRLYANNEAFDKERAVSVLKSVLVIQRGDHAVFLKDDVPLNTEDRILAFALVKRLLWSEGMDEQSSSSAKEISLKTGIA